jgi:PhzF family phenazine biosynthesis protein
MQRRFQQVDVFSDTLLGNPVAVVLDADGLSDEQMQRFARWTNLSETTFVLPPTDPRADYRVRIFTPGEELPFAGHPTLGTAHAWAGSSAAEELVQECAAGLIPLRRTEGDWAFAAPPLVRSGPVSDEDLAVICEILGVGAVQDAQWVDNGPGWVAVVLESVEELMALRPGALRGYFIGAVALHPGGDPADVEVRAFFDVDGMTVEDPVTGSLNASLAPWLTQTGRLRFPYSARQGTAIGRDGRVRLTQADGEVWVAGATVTRVVGTVAI